MRFAQPRNPAICLLTNNGTVKTTTLTATVLAIFVATIGQGDDAAIKKELLGHWFTGRHVFLYTSEGVGFNIDRDGGVPPKVDWCRRVEIVPPDTEYLMGNFLAMW
jgi:hypothetical protein